MSDPYTLKPTRREVSWRLASAGLATAAVVTGVLAFRDRRAAAARTEAVPDWRVATGPPGRPVVAARGADPAVNTRRCIAGLGGIERFVRAGDRVVIKPNVGWDRLPEQGANTDPGVVAELVRLCRGAGAARVVVTDISCNESRRSFDRSGIGAAAAAAGAVVIPGGGELVAADLAGYAAGLEVIAELLAATRVINVPVVKHHGLARVTLGMKNWMGVLGRGRNRLHQDIDRAAAELAATFRPTLTVVDATRVLATNGPQGGSLADVREVGAVAAGIDPVMCDAWGAVQFGLDPRQLDCLGEASRRGLGRADASGVQELGTT